MRVEWGLMSPRSPRVYEGCQCMHRQELSTLGEAANSRCHVKADRILCLPFANQRKKTCAWGSLTAVDEAEVYPIPTILQKVGLGTLFINCNMISFSPYCLTIRIFLSVFSE